ncbi:MAG: ferrochelatase [Actinomycetota bacterium]
MSPRRPPYDALLIVSFGGPEGPDDVLPFLRNVTSGRGVPDERLAEVAEQYLLFDGVSPLPAHDRALVEAVRADLGAQGIDLPVHLGNRNWHPMLADTLARMRDDGVERALAFVTSAYSSYSGCRQYREDIDAARFAVGPGAPEVHKLRAFHNHPGFVEPFVDGVRTALDRLPGARLVYTAHSIPVAMAETSDYVEQLADTAGLVAASVGVDDWDLVWQSRSGPPSVPWLEPDVGDHLHSLADGGTTDVVLVPIGFVADHQEVRFDLDTQAAEIAAGTGITLERVSTPGLDERYVAMIRELVLERLRDEPRRALGVLGPRQDVCGVGCCPAPRRRPARAE